MANVPEREIRLAIFGESAAGKTTLLASYFGNQQRDSFEQRHGYRLEAEDTSDANELLGRYYGMEDGRYPRGTDEFREYRFALMMQMQDHSERAFRVVWYDYPGGWWERTPNDEGEQQARREALAKLATCHAGILLLDGAKYRRDGPRYAQRLLGQFRNEVAQLGTLQAGDALPRAWIIAVSKADLLEPGTTAEQIYKELTRDASDELSALAGALNARRTFGRHFLLLSAVQGSEQTVLDAHRYIGLTLIAPLSLSAIMDALRAEADTGKRYGRWRTFLEKVRDFVRFVDSVDDVFPPHYQAVTLFLRLLSADDLLQKGTEYFEKKREFAARKGRALEAAAYALQRELRLDEAQGVYHEARS